SRSALLIIKTSQLREGFHPNLSHLREATVRFIPNRRSCDVTDGLYSFVPLARASLTCVLGSTPRSAAASFGEAGSASGTSQGPGVPERRTTARPLGHD